LSDDAIIDVYCSTFAGFALTLAHPSRAYATRPAYRPRRHPAA